MHTQCTMCVYPYIAYCILQSCKTAFTAEKLNYLPWTMSATTLMAVSLTSMKLFDLQVQCMQVLTCVHVIIESLKVYFTTHVLPECRNGQ